MLLRCFWPKEVMLGSSRSNATNTYFSTWVRVSGTRPHTINTVAVMKAFLRRSTDPEEFGLHDMPQLEGSFQPLFYARRVKGKLQKASVDHCSNVIQAGIKRCDMGSMKTCHIRGASASKIVQLVPDAMPPALGLGRWTTKRLRRCLFNTIRLQSKGPGSPHRKSYSLMHNRFCGGVSNLHHHL